MGEEDPRAAALLRPKGRLVGSPRRYLQQKDDFEAGCRPKPAQDDADALTVQEMVARFLEARCLDVDSGALDLRTWWMEYEDHGERMIRDSAARPWSRLWDRKTS